MKKSLMIAAVAAALLMSGCSQKEPEVDMTKQETMTQETTPAVTEADSGVSAVVGGEEISDITTLPEDERMAKIREIEASAKKIYFDFDKYNIRPDQEPRVDEDAKLFASDAAKDLTVKIEGNCDEWGTDEYNYALGLRRAKTVRDALSLKGIDSSRMVMVSYGESNPVCTEHTKECWAKNRRVEFELLP
ncbi:OmpA family protein [Hydrogenimonas cancrithermarum]|uniref:Peptidoglycan-associated lipoprotein n=1 Tax=Hydrogenimonas cancrithermarum TaxID=2993563 RepID=A0ABN6WTE5_9BACT|nr:OmpA family protein [Hydrogenimonas cancrithermarum]BDY12334.1 peptidoglycan-associated lipoprotein [Hydrogenimonas cancrithermarum]